MLDGMVAVARTKRARRGEILNDLPDRISTNHFRRRRTQRINGNSDFGIGPRSWQCFYCICRLFGQALGVRREFGGVMSKPWRMIVLHIGAWLTIFLRGQSFTSFTILDWTCLVVIAGCVQTIVFA